MRRLALIAPLLLVATALVVGGHVYIARRLVLDPGLAEPWRSALLGAVALGFASLLLQPFNERLLRPPISRVLAWPASLWMGLAFLLVNLLWVSDLLLWFAGNPALAAAAGAGSASPAATARAAVVAALAFVAAGFGLRGALRPAQLRRVELALPRWPAALNGFRIVQISDLHIGPLLGRRFAEQITARVNALGPDLVAVTGDLVDGGVRQLFDEVAPFAALRGRHGVFFVTGNHDHYSGARGWAARARELGMRVLRNEHIAIGEGEAAFDLVGVDDHRGELMGGDGGEDLDAALAGRDPRRPAVLLAHDPSTFKRAAGRDIDLQLSGHTHGGQIWPFAAIVRLAIPYVAGHYQRDGAQLYVSRGTGFWGPPMRLLAPAEITELVLRRSA